MRRLVLIVILALAFMASAKPAKAVEPVLMIVGGGAALSLGYTIIYRVFINPDWVPHSPADWYKSPAWSLDGRDHR